MYAPVVNKVEKEEKKPKSASQTFLCSKWFRRDLEIICAQKSKGKEKREKKNGDTKKIVETAADA